MRCRSIDLRADSAWFKANSLAVPETLDDLLKPEYKDLLVVSNPASSSPGLAFLALAWMPTMQAPYGHVATVTHAVANLITAIWSIYGTALWLLAWYRLRAIKDDLTLAHFAAELDPSLPAPPPSHQLTGVARDEPQVPPTTPLRRRKRR